MVDVKKLPQFKAARTALHDEKYDQVIELCDEIIKRHSEFHEPYQLRGNAYASKGDYDEALDEYDQALKLLVRNPFSFHLGEYEGLLYDRGRVFALQGDHPRAIRNYSSAIAGLPRVKKIYHNYPTEPWFYVARADSYSKIGKFEEAIQDYNHVVENHPNSKVHGQAFDLRKQLQRRMKSMATQNRLLRMLASSPTLQDQDAKQAVPSALALCKQTKWNQPKYIDTLAAAYAQVGQFDKAVEWQQKALELAKSDKEWAVEAKARLQLYQQKKPYRRKRPEKKSPDKKQSTAPPK